MPKIGMEPLRRKALVDATLRAVGDHGSLTVSMSEIARHAGVSPALAHHYFGSKEQLVIETIRSLLRTLREDAVAALRQAATPRDRISAVIRVNFQAHQFAPETVAAWLAFYTEAQRSEEVRRLLVVYARRLNSNLLSSLKRLCTPQEAAAIADGAAAMIDGLYLRQGLRSAPVSIESSIALTESYVDAQLAAVAGVAAADAGKRAPVIQPR
ncbi:transcriptional regulator BetI [Shinella sumterensis]|uniref:HTH-type transcriptional regulator BetI n=1 Tax=Shinella sumterensis TaxID=1967501 RepID=A0AA50HFD8_9HYPH|nr:transcriptional regulator BetI [Shinella sumterensis]MDP9589463.1 TetR/AcrR family transcriptional repressor of bet genes [Shinella zoogloeoides]WLR96150.1 transcriptional regulator BetI [Shinella sumterensis]WLS09335.1 transcriptional regulator BetI [Shinella sumterensis]